MLNTLFGGTNNSTNPNGGTAVKSAPEKIAANKPNNGLEIDPTKIPAAIKEAARNQLGNLSANNPAATDQVVYQGDPDNQVIVFDGDETLWDDSDKHIIDENKVKELGRKLEIIPKDAPGNKMGKEIKYVLRPGVEELFNYLKSRGYKIIICTRNYEDLAETMVAQNPVLKRCVDGVLGRNDLTGEMNKDFTKNPKHPDNISIWQKTKSFCFKYFWWYPTYPFRYLYSLLAGTKPPRLPATPGELGKHPPIMNAMIKAEGNNKLDGCKPARFLVDNKVEYETDDPADPTKFQYKKDAIDFANSARSDFAVISPNIVRNPGEKKANHFFAEFNEPKIKVKDSNGGNEKEVYLWVKNVIDAIERGWKAQYKLLHGKDPS